jgi:hypothetical protein
MEERLKGPRNPILGIIFVFAFSVLGFSSATKNFYITPDGKAQGACTTNPQTPAWFNNSSNWGSGSNQIGPGTTVTVCGNFTAAAGATEFTFRGSGTSGNPIILLFDTGATLSAPYWSGSNGAINISGLSYVTVDGQNTGIIQNTGNGDGLANRQISMGISGKACNNCTVENLTIANIYIALKNYSNPLGGSATQMNAIYMTGSNWTLSGNTIHDCGWCIYIPYGPGDTNYQLSSNDIYNWDHAIMFAAPGAISCAAPCLLLHDNQIHDNINWETSGCVYHLDGLHTFGTSGSSMDGVYIYNNYFFGSLSGGCSSGFIFIEGGGSSTPSNLKNLYFWNNVGDATEADSANANGWFGLFSASASMTVVNNTLLYNNTNDMTECYAIGGATGGNVVNNLTFENNVVNGCNLAIYIPELTGTTTIDQNFYGDACSFSNNCFVWKGTFEGKLSAWRSACNCDSLSLVSTFLGALLNSDGSPQAGSPVIGVGNNLSSMATGNLASLKNDTSKGNTRTPIARPQTGPWDIGAYLYSIGGTRPNPPTGLTAIVN